MVLFIFHVVQACDTDTLLTSQKYDCDISQNNFTDRQGKRSFVSFVRKWWFCSKHGEYCEPFIIFK